MTKRYEIYKCDKCGNIAMMLEGGKGQMVCCGKPMEKLEQQSADQTTEKHVPVVEKVEGGYKVVVGSTLHPMADAHYINWVSLETEKQNYFEFLEPGSSPEVFFKTDEKAVRAYEYCNLHGLWVKQID